MATLPPYCSSVSTPIFLGASNNISSSSAPITPMPIGGVPDDTFVKVASTTGSVPNTTNADDQQQQSQQSGLDPAPALHHGLHQVVEGLRR